MSNRHSPRRSEHNWQSAHALHLTWTHELVHQWQTNTAQLDTKVTSLLHGLKQPGLFCNPWKASISCVFFSPIFFSRTSLFLVGNLGRLTWVWHKGLRPKAWKSIENPKAFHAGNVLTCGHGVLDRRVIVGLPAVGRNLLVLDEVTLDLLATIILRLRPHQGHGRFIHIIHLGWAWCIRGGWKFTDENNQIGHCATCAQCTAK